MRRHPKSEVIVVGAGPVGLTAAMVLKARGVGVTVFDARGRTAGHSYALALHPSTLGLLDRLGVGAACRKEGRAIERIGIYEGRRRTGEIDFTRLSGDHRHVLVLPQARLEAILETALGKAGLEVHWHHRVQGLDARPDGVRCAVAKLDKVSTGYPIAHTEAVVDELFDAEADYVVGADGYDSFVRRRLGIACADHGRGQVYSVFEVEAGGDAPQEGRLTVDGDRVVGYWPLPNGRCRFSFPIDAAEEHRADPETLASRIRAGAPWFAGTAGAIGWTATGLFERKLAASFGGGRVWMAGDSAHLTGPLGAQSMNVGLLEAEDLAGRIARALRDGAGRRVFEEYGEARSREWRSLFGAEMPHGSRRSLLLPCVPASGDDLAAALNQLNS